MAKSKKSKKKVVVSKTTEGKESPKVSTSNRASRKSTGNATYESAMLFDKQNYILILASFCIITLGMLLMMGGNMPSPDVWDESLIYSTRRTLLAPFVIVCGLILGFYAIFKK